MNKEEIRSRVSQIQWFHNYEVVPGVMTNGVSPMLERGDYFEIPQDLSGKRVLDIGCADGYFTFLAESRGAEVVSIDAWPRQGFFLAHEIRGSRAEFHQLNVYDLQPDTLGMFDIVFFFGVYYHLKNPILALERIASVTREYAIVESHIMGQTQPAKRSKFAIFRQIFQGKRKDNCSVDFDDEGLSRFYEHDELGNDPTNWWTPNVPCLLQTVRAAGFPRVELVTCYDGNRAIVRAYKGPRTVGKALTEDFFIAIDIPRPNAEITGPVQISGFALSQLDPEVGIDRLTIYLDNLDEPGAELGQAEYGRWRTDLTPHFGDRYGSSGFQFTWDASKIAPGKHMLYILAEGKRGWYYRAVPVVVKQ